MKSSPAVAEFECACGKCNRVFRTKLHLGRHYQCSGHGPVRSAIIEAKQRHSCSFRRKRDLLLELDGLDGDVSLLATRTGISRKTNGIH